MWILWKTKKASRVKKNLTESPLFGSGKAGGRRVEKMGKSGKGGVRERLWVNKRKKQENKTVGCGEKEECGNVEKRFFSTTQYCDKP